jgi:diphosphomevalonate decarboxylase
MPDLTATGAACPNIALIKYWGNRDNNLRIPSNGSISMNLGGLFSHTHVTFTADLNTDQLNLDGQAIRGEGLQRAATLLEKVRRLAGLEWFARVESYNNFPTGTGIASSASGFAALAAAAACAAGLEMDEAGLSRLARTASGSACRSIPGGFVEWLSGADDYSSYAVSIAPPQHWNLVDCIAIVSQSHKPTGSSEGHALANSSPLQDARVADTLRRLDICRSAIENKDFTALAEIMELDSNLMHAVMMTSTPRLLYWLPGTLEVIHAVTTWRRSGLPAAYTIDAGPNVHVICPGEYAAQVAARLNQLPGIQRVLSARPGGPARCSAALESR